MVCLTSGLFSQTDEELRVKKIAFEGNEHFSDGYLRSLMEIRTKNFMERIFFWRKGPVFSQGILEDDLVRISRAYQKEGFLNVSVKKGELEYDRSGSKVNIYLVINEGRRVKVSSLIFDFQEPAADKASKELPALRERLLLTEGSYFRDNDFREDLRTISSFYDQLGYPFIRVSHEILLDPEEEEVALRYQISSGPKSYLGRIFYTGLNKIEERLLRKHLSISPGDPYNRMELDRTRTRLQSLGMFQLVSVNLRLDSVREEVPVEISVRENDSTSLSFGIGYGIEDRVRVYTEITRLRFLGGLRKGTFFVKHSYLEPLKLDFKLTQPAFPTIHSTVILNPFYRREREPGYLIERIGGNTTINYRLSSRTGTYLTYTFENNELKESAESNGSQHLFGKTISYYLEQGFEEERELWQGRAFQGSDSRENLPLKRSYRKSSITWGIIRDSSQPVFYPRKGSLLSNAVTFSGLGFGSDFRFIRVLSEARFYNSLLSDLVLATRLKGGVIKGLTTGEYIPIEERLYAGGTYSVRGWARSRLGPLSSDDQPLGGKSLLEGSIEFRYPLWRQLSGVAFFDYGNVWSESFDHAVNDLRYATGGGLRFATPVGPFRFDIGTPVGEGKKPVQFFISLGQAF